MKVFLMLIYLPILICMPDLHFAKEPVCSSTFCWTVCMFWPKGMGVNRKKQKLLEGPYAVLMSCKSMALLYTQDTIQFLPLTVTAFLVAF